MRAPILWLLMALATLLAGCATRGTTVVACGEATVCPRVLVYRLSGAGYVAHPDVLDTSSDDTKVVMWGFAEESDFYFDSNALDTSKQDGVDFTTFSKGTASGVNPCFATNSPDGSTMEERGRFFRCKLRSHGYVSAQYKLRFHSAQDSVQRMVDPGITNTRTGFQLMDAPAALAPGAANMSPKPVNSMSPRVAAAPAVFKAALNTSTVRIQLSAAGGPLASTGVPGAGSFTTIVMWDLPGSGYVFDTDPAQGVADGIDPTKVPACWTTNDAGGGPDSTVGSYYQCTFFSNSPIFPAAYDILFRDRSTGVVVKSSGMLTR